MNFHQFEERLEKEFTEFKRDVKKPNILLIGATGVGKSSLINICFGEELARVGVGKPVTDHIESFSCSSIPVVLFDTKGYEIGSDKEKEFLHDVVKYATNSASSDRPIHIVWYCIQASGGRIVDFDVSIINQICQAGLPVGLILTKADLLSKGESKLFRSEIESLLPKIAIFETSIKTDLNNLELAELCQWSVNSLPSALKISFAAAQKKNISIKRDEATKVVSQHSAGAAFVGFAPIPFSDAPILLANQAGMIARILFIYNMGAFTDIVKDLLGGVAIGSLISQSGVWIAAQLLKFFPGIGTIVGGVINGTVATALTYAIGISISELCARFLEIALSGDTKKLQAFVDDMPTYFSDLVKISFKQQTQE